MATHGPTLLICAFGEDSEVGLGTSPHSSYSVGIGPSDYPLFGSCMRPHYVTNETLQEAVHFHLQTAEMEFCHHSLIFRLIVHWQKCICHDRILLRSEAVPRLD
jgi:hypothetical protein